MRTRAFCLVVAGSLSMLLGGSAIASPAGSATRSSSLLPPGHENQYLVTNLVSDQAGQAKNTDPNLVNAWGLAAGPSTPWWVADNETGLSTIYDGDGNVVPLVVSVADGVTGLVFNGGNEFVVHHGSDSGPSVFLFSTEDGIILGWNPNVPPPPPSTQAFVVADRSGVGANYKGLAIASTDEGDFLYATDFHNGRVDTFDGSFNLVNVGSFSDPKIPHGYAPFGIQTIDDTVFVTYAKQDAEGSDEVAGMSLGFVDAYTTGGELIRRVASHGLLNAPWGLAVAPEGFGRFGGDLLVGNFGNGRINAYQQRANGSYRHAGTLRTAKGSALAVDGLWALEFGLGGPSGSPDTLFFTAGPDDEAHGLFGKIEAMH